MPATTDDICGMGFARAVGAAIVAIRLGMALAARMGAFFGFIGGHDGFLAIEIAGNGDLFPAISAVIQPRP
jgi:hypothetical protein